MNLSFSKPRNVDFFQKLNQKKKFKFTVEEKKKSKFLSEKNQWEKDPIFIQGSDD